MYKGEKNEMVLEYLRKGIYAGEWDHCLLPKEKDLAEKFHVARETVRRAFIKLTNEGLVERKRHVGTMLRHEYHSQKLICSVLRSSGHFFDDLFCELQKYVAAVGCRLQSVDMYGFDVPNMRRSVRRSIRSLLQIVDNHLLLDGYVFRSYPQIDELLKKHPVFFDFFDSKRPDGVTAVLIDYREIGRIGAKYLLSKGCRHPLLIDNAGPTVHARFSPEIYKEHQSKQLCDGFSEVLRDAGLDPIYCMYFSNIHRKSEDDLAEIFSYPQSRPDGIFSSCDATLDSALHIGKECGFIPRWVLGCFSTPWSRGMGGFTFPSITVSPNLCAKALVEQVLLPKEKRKDVLIKPYLKE